MVGQHSRGGQFAEVEARAFVTDDEHRPVPRDLGADVNPPVAIRRRIDALGRDPGVFVAPGPWADRTDLQVPVVVGILQRFLDGNADPQPLDFLVSEMLNANEEVLGS